MTGFEPATCGSTIHCSTNWATHTVGVQGFEPWASWSQTTRTAKLCYTPRSLPHLRSSCCYYDIINCRIQDCCQDDEIINCWHRITPVPFVDCLWCIKTESFLHLVYGYFLFLDHRLYILSGRIHIYCRHNFCFLSVLTAIKKTPDTLEHLFVFCLYGV